ncbi:MAG TPA: hypothetical protein VMI35_00620 [Puia sp.]|nr:hypothetical protein [Puia sp.]
MHFTKAQKVHYTLRIAVAMCFIGHGAFGIITKPIWCNYFAVMGIGHNMAYRMMPVVGSVDILFGLIMLAYPIRAIPLWLVGWGIVTAMLRPLSGEPFAEFIERAGNFGAPLSLLILHGGLPRTFKELFSPLIPEVEPDDATWSRVKNCLKIVAFLLLAGHGWLNLVEKKGLLGQYSSIGFSNPAAVARLLGVFEILAACLLFIRPARPVIFFLLCWKAGSELFYPRYELFEWVERGGSYGSLLALWLAMGKQSSYEGGEGKSSGARIILNSPLGRQAIEGIQRITWKYQRLYK